MVIHRHNLAVVVGFLLLQHHKASKGFLQRECKKNNLIWRILSCKSDKTITSSVIFLWVVNPQTDENSERINEQ